MKGNELYRPSTHQAPNKHPTTSIEVENLLKALNGMIMKGNKTNCITI